MRMILFTLFILSCLSLQAGTSPTYSVAEVPDPPSKFETNQVDGLTFLPDGRLVVCLPSGEVFFHDAAKKEWQLFAEGLHNPLGVIALSNTDLVVSQRPELTLVRDTDGDGKADAFEVMSDAFGMSGNYHEFHFTPVRDSDGSYFFALGTGSSGDGIRAIVRGKFEPRGRPGRMHASTPYRGCIMKLTPDGKTIPWSFGHRTPNGLGFDLDGNLFVTDNQGDWVGSSKLFHVKRGRFYGHAASLAWKEGFEGTPLETDPETLARLRSRACIVFPHGTMANSPTKVLAITPEANFGPFTGQLLVGEMNKPRIVRVMLEEVGGELQGACVPLIDGKPLRTGCNRMAWAPDGSLYIGHTKHTWAGSSGITRVSWNGEVPFEGQKMELTETGFRFTFTKPVNREIAEKPETWPFQRYYYQYHESYGSPQMEVTPIEVSSIRVSPDARVVELDLAELKAWHIHEVTVTDLPSADGDILTNHNFVYTLNRLLGETPPDPLQFGLGKKKPKKAATREPIPVIDALGAVYQAADAEKNGPRMATNNEGYTGIGFADFGKDPQSMEWTVEATETGGANLIFRYALASSARPLRLILNGTEIKILPFEPTGSWTKWQDLSATVELKYGENKITLETTGKSGPNIDHLQVVDL